MADWRNDKILIDVSVIFSENRPTATVTVTQKSSPYILEVLDHIFNFIFKASQYPWMKVLINQDFFSK